MAGRATQSQHPDVEALQAELAALEARKHTLQDEMLAVAADKKRLHEEFAIDKARLEEELAQKHREGGVELGVLDKAIATAKAKKEQAEREVEGALSKTHDLKSILAAHGEAAARLASTHEAIVTAEEQLQHLTIAHQEAEKTIAAHQFFLGELTKQREPLETSLEQLKTDIAQASTERDHIESEISVLKQAHRETHASKEQKALELDGVLSQIDERLGVRIELEHEIAALEGRKTAHEADMAQKEASLTERVGNAARLEMHVDEKLQHLKELENRFTTEHLARMGYTKTE